MVRTIDPGPLAFEDLLPALRNRAEGGERLCGRPSGAWGRHDCAWGRAVTMDLGEERDA